jgi:hypothetical protein
MKHLLDLTLAGLACLAFAACGDKPADKKPEEPHEHKAPHGGEIIELGSEEGHIEVKHEDDAGKITLWIYGPSLEKPVFVVKPTLTLQAKDGSTADVPLTAADAKPDGTGHTWTAEHPNLKVEPLEGRVQVTIAGKQYQPRLADDHKHK